MILTRALPIADAPEIGLRRELTEVTRVPGSLFDSEQQRVEHGQKRPKRAGRRVRACEGLV